MNVKIYKCFNDVFNCLPIAALIENKIFCCHGGLSPNLRSLEQLKRISRPMDVDDKGLVCDLLWSDPSPQPGWGPNDRGVSYTFGADVLNQFLQKHELDLVVRAHQVVEDGYEFFGKRQLVTIFSAPNYCQEFDNAAAIMSINQELLCSFQVSRTQILIGTLKLNIFRSWNLHQMCCANDAPTFRSITSPSFWALTWSQPPSCLGAVCSDESSNFASPVKNLQWNLCLVFSLTSSTTKFLLFIRLFQFVHTLLCGRFDC